MIYLMQYDISRKEGLLMNFQQEDIHTEYKTAKNKIPNAMWETISSFANTDGGNIYLGIKEIKKKGVPSEFIVSGIQNAQEMKNELLNQLKNKNKISSPVVSEENIKIHAVDGLEIIEISVPRAEFHNRPVFIKGDVKNTYIREGERDSKATEDDLKAIIRDSSETDNYQLLDNFSIEDDLNIIDIQNYKAYLIEKSQEDIYSQLSTEEFLENIGLFRKDRTDGAYKLCKAALLLFGKYNSITDIYHSFFLDFIVKDDATDVNYTDRIYTSDIPGHPNNIMSFYFAVLGKMSSLVQNSFELDDDMSRKDSGEKLLRSLREALVNSLVHADYQANFPTKISFYKNKVEFVNPGQVMVSLSQFFESSDSKTRNDLIFQTFIRSKLGEHTGSGGATILNTSIKLKLNKPEIESIPSKTSLIIWKESHEDFIEKLPSEWRETYMLISKQIIVAFSDLRHLYKNDYQGKKILKEMIEANIIEKTGEKRGTKYRISGSDPSVKQRMDQMIEILKRSVHNR